MDTLVRRIKEADPQIDYVEANVKQRAQQVVNDSRFNEQWDLRETGTSVNAIPAWNVATGNGVAVAVVDTGFRPHADLQQHLLSGFDFIADRMTSGDGEDRRDADASDPGDFVAAGECGPIEPAETSSWHGTHVAGTIAAVTNNNEGIAGIARNARILPVRVLGKCGGFLADITDGMRWAAGLPVPGVPNNPNPARVINLSLGGSGPCGPTYTKAIADIRQKGVTIVVAAGNSRSDASNFNPANCAGVITVAATNRQGGRAFYSNTGSIVQVSAPGGETSSNLSDGILSTLNAGMSTPGADSYQSYQGTSMATPHVAAIIALMYEVNPQILPDEAAAVVRRTAQPFPSVSTRPCDTSTCGTGIADGAAAVNDVKGDKGNTSASAVRDVGKTNP
jgi:serine protease